MLQRRSLTYTGRTGPTMTSNLKISCCNRLGGWYLASQTLASQNFQIIASKVVTYTIGWLGFGKNFKNRSNNGKQLATIAEFQAGMFATNASCNPGDTQISIHVNNSHTSQLLIVVLCASPCEEGDFVFQLMKPRVCIIQLPL